MRGVLVAIAVVLLSGCGGLGPASQGGSSPESSLDGSSSSLRSLESSSSPSLDKRPYTAKEAVEAARLALGLDEVQVISLQAHLDGHGRSLRWRVWLANETSGFSGFVHAPGAGVFYPPYGGEDFPEGKVVMDPIPRFEVPVVPDGFLDSGEAVARTGRKDVGAQLASMAGRPTWLVAQSNASKAIDAVSGAPLELPREYSFGDVHAIAEPMALRWAADARLEGAFATEENQPSVDHGILSRAHARCLGEASGQVHFRLDRVPSDGRAPVWFLQYFSPARNETAAWLYADAAGSSLGVWPPSTNHCATAAAPANATWVDSDELHSRLTGEVAYELTTATGEWRFSWWRSDLVDYQVFDARSGPPIRP